MDAGETLIAQNSLGRGACHSLRPSCLPPSAPWSGGLPSHSPEVRKAGISIFPLGALPLLARRTWSGTENHSFSIQTARSKSLMTTALQIHSFLNSKSLRVEPPPTLANRGVSSLEIVLEPRGQPCPLVCKCWVTNLAPHQAGPTAVGKDLFLCTKSWVAEEGLSRRGCRSPGVLVSRDRGSLYILCLCLSLCHVAKCPLSVCSPCGSLLSVPLYVSDPIISNIR